MNTARAIKATTSRIPTSVAGSAMLELEASLADASGPEADCGLLPPDPLVGAVPGDPPPDEFGASVVTLAGMVTLGATTLGDAATGAWVVSPADFGVDGSCVTAGDAVDSGTRVVDTVVAAASPFDVDGDPVETGVVVPGMAGPDVGALPDGDETGAGTDGDDVGGVDVGVGSTGDATPVELRFVVPGVAGPDVGALPVGDETGAGTDGDDVGGVDVGVGSTGDATGAGCPVGGGEAGGVGVAGVGVGLGGGAVAADGTTSKRNAFPLLSTATQDEPEMQDTAFRLPRRSSRVGVDHADPLYVR
jgi:hypothetical protein